MEACEHPQGFFCAGAENRIDDQTDGKCAAYAAAYLLRRFGEDADGEERFTEKTVRLRFRKPHRGCFSARWASGKSLPRKR